MTTSRKEVFFMGKKTHYYIIDFDSTFVRIEALDLLAEIALKDNANKHCILQKIKHVTNAGMNGEISFLDSLTQRLALFSANKKHIALLSKQLSKFITLSFTRNKAFFKSNSQEIFILSGGFHEYIYPVVKKFGIPEDHVLANTFLYDQKENIIGFDRKMYQDKVSLVKELNLSGEIFVIGDGMTDAEIRTQKQANYFYAFTENITREAVIKHADYQVKNFDEFLYQLHLRRSVSFPKSKIKVLLLENIHPRANEFFTKESYDVESLSNSLSEEELIKKISEVSILGIRSKTQITKNILAHAKKLLTIGAYCIGTNQIDLQTCTNQGIAVFNAPFSNTRSVAELIIGEIIFLSRKLITKNIQLHKGIWDKSAQGCHEIRKKKLGIIGYGHIGSQVSILAEALGMETYFYNTSDTQPYGNAKKCHSMEEILKICDVITIHVDGKKENKNLIGEKQFKLMKENVLFLNASRDFVVDMEALVKYINNGKIAGCAIDVFPNEPHKNGSSFSSPLQNKPNTIITPHMGSGTEEGQENIGIFVSEKILSFINEGSTSQSVNFPALQLPHQKNTHRFLHVHKNISGILAKINTILATNNCNIEGQYLKTNTEIGYVITDVNKRYNDSTIDELKNLEETIRFRILY